MRNADLARVFRDLAVYLDMDDVPFKPRAYEKAAAAIEAHDEPLADVYRRGGPKALRAVPGIGASTAGKLEELLTTGRCEMHETYRERMPVDLHGLLAVEGIGPKGVKVLWEALGVRTIDDLAAAARDGRVRALPHFGEKSEQRILRAVGFVAASSRRRLLCDVLPLVEVLIERLRRVAGVHDVTVAGSLRRRRETVGDVDVLVVADDAGTAMRSFVEAPDVEVVLGRGDTRSSVRLAGGLQADLRVVPGQSFGAALAYFTGSKAHNVALRQLAIKQKLKLNEYGLFRGDRAVAGRREAEVYEVLGLAWIPPELREDQGEITAARDGTLPALLPHGSLRGDLQIQTDWTDGTDSIEAMARAARDAGLEYIAITDHTRGLPMARGCDPATLRRQRGAIAEAQARVPEIRLLCGAEVDIERDGSLAIDDATLATLDVVGIAVHSHFHLPRAEQTARIVRAMQNPHADILFHPTGRLLLRREPYDVDIDAIIDAARATGTALELDASPDRLDLRDDHLRKAVAAGVGLVIDSDAHAAAHVGFGERYGVDQARRGWVTAGDVLNTRPLDGLLAALKDGAGTSALRRPADPRGS